MVSSILNGPWVWWDINRSYIMQTSISPTMHAAATDVHSSWEVLFCKDCADTLCHLRAQNVSWSSTMKITYVYNHLNSELSWVYIWKALLQDDEEMSARAYFSKKSDFVRIKRNWHQKWAQELSTHWSNYSPVAPLYSTHHILPLYFSRCRKAPTESGHTKEELQWNGTQ